MALTAQQRQVLQTILREGRRADASPREMKAAVLTGRVESDFSNPDHGDRDSVGWRQERSPYGSKQERMNVSHAARRFFAEAKSVNRRGFKGSAGELAQAVQRSAFPERYDAHSAEADELLARFGSKSRSTNPVPSGDGMVTLPGGQQVPSALLEAASPGSGLSLPQPRGIQVTAPAPPAFSATSNLHDPRTVAVQPSGAPAPRSSLEQLLAGVQAEGELPGGGDTPVEDTGKSAPPGGSGGGRGIQLDPNDGWGGAHSVGHPASRIAQGNGLAIGSTKRPTKGTATGGVSDHWEGKQNAWAYDFGDGSYGQMKQSGQEIARHYGVKFKENSYSSGGVIRVGGKRVRVQILLGGKIDHADHLHVGFEVVG